MQSFVKSSNLFAFQKAKFSSRPPPTDPLFPGSEIFDLPPEYKRRVTRRNRIAAVVAAGWLIGILTFTFTRVTRNDFKDFENERKTLVPKTPNK